jgi:ParB family chromosome partitioning protein
MTDFKTIPLSEIHPDKNQPRKFINDISLKELTESVKLKGVIQPIMVRPNKTGYILVCGERRVKASVAAGLKDVPAVVRNLTDEEALEIQFIENIQRDDVHPMDEASTF